MYKSFIPLLVESTEEFLFENLGLKCNVTIVDNELMNITIESEKGVNIIECNSWDYYKKIQEYSSIDYDICSEQLMTRTLKKLEKYDFYTIYGNLGYKHDGVNYCDNIILYDYANEYIVHIIRFTCVIYNISRLFYYSFKNDLIFIGPEFRLGTHKCRFEEYENGQYSSFDGRYGECLVTKLLNKKTLANCIKLPIKLARRSDLIETFECVENEIPTIEEALS